MGTLWAIAKAVFTGDVTGLLKDAGWMVFAWNVLGKAMGAGFYRFVALAGLVLGIAVAIGHFWKGGKFASFKAYRGIGLLLSVLALTAFCTGMLGAIAGSIAETIDARRAPAHRRSQDVPPPANSAPPFLDQTING